MSTITVKTQTGQSIKLDDSKEIARGGEGKILLIPSMKDMVAKVYHPGISPINQNKYQFLNKLDEKLFVKPHDLLFSSSALVVGFTMEYLGQDYFPLSSLFNRTFCKQNIIDKKFKKAVIEKLINAVDYAHKLNVIIGDLNGFNIMINKKGDVKFIDVDAYETPGHVHSGRLLEEIRDYLYQGKINENSDYFALAALSFNSLTFVHPFKGMHSKYPKTSDRMIQKLPVFIKDSELTVPKCYEPVQDTILQSQFDRIFCKGERFLISLSGVDNTLLVRAMPKLPVTKVVKNDLIITSVLLNSEIRYVHFLDNKGIVTTDSEFIIYDASNKGYLSELHKFPTKDWDRMFIGNKNIVGCKNNELWIHQKGNTFVKVTNIQMPNEPLMHQLENVLMIVGPEHMDKVFLDDAFGTVIKTEQTHVFGKGFSIFNGFIHNAGGKQNIFFNVNNDVSITQSPLLINGVFQRKNVGIFQYIEKHNVKFKFFKIKDLKVQVSNEDLTGINNFAFKNDASGEGFIFQPIDGAIRVLRTQDFQEISKIDLDLVSADSILENSNAGIILCENNQLWLLNKK
jgi:serine/threonine protein kinase